MLNIFPTSIAAIIFTNIQSTSLPQQILDRYSSSAKYSTGTPKYFAKTKSLSNFGVLRPVFQSERTD
nr:MAG TPA: hypothetical protein [Caudoviricetes sp.]